MWELARRNLLQERTRFVVSVGGVAFSVVLMLLLLGLYNGYQQRIADYFGGIQADLWVVQSGTSNFFHSSSILPSAGRSRIASVRGIESVEPYVGRQIGFEVDGKQYVTYVVGVHGGQAIDGPVRVIEGASLLSSEEIALNRSLAHASSVSIGDTVELRGRPFRVVALTDGGDMVMYQYSLVIMRDAYALQGSYTTVNFFLVQIDPGASVSRVARRIDEAIPEGEVWTPMRVVAENQGLIKDTFLPVIGVLVAIGFVVGTAVIGLTTYSGVVERRREYGVFKALGADGWATFRTVLMQSAVAGAVGYLVGLGASIALGGWLPGLVPQFAVQLEPRYMVWVMLCAAGMVAASVALPVMRMSRIDPAEVFQA